LLVTGVQLPVSRGTVASLITDKDAMVMLPIVRVSYVGSVLRGDLCLDLLEIRKSIPSGREKE
jgi:hypothetical protein